MVIAQVDAKCLPIVAKRLPLTVYRLPPTIHSVGIFFNTTTHKGEALRSLSKVTVGGLSGISGGNTKEIQK